MQLAQSAKRVKDEMKFDLGSWGWGNVGVVAAWPGAWGATLVHHSLPSSLSRLSLSPGFEQHHQECAPLSSVVRMAGTSHRLDTDIASSSPAGLLKFGTAAETKSARSYCRG